MDKKKLEKICRLIRYDILTSTTCAGSGHPTSSLSAVELTAVLFFNGYFKQDIKDPKNIVNDRFVLSKGHAAPLLYSLYHLAGVIPYEKLLTLRKFGSLLEGHPTPRFPYADVATGSLGQGLSVGLGMALGIKLKIKNEELRVKREPKVWVLLGDSELAEGQVWEAIQLASFYKLNNLVGIVDVNRLGQRGETMLGWDINTYKKRVASFGWKTVVVDDGNDLTKVHQAFEKVCQPLISNQQSPTMIIVKTVKGKGISFLENKDGWHGKPVPKDMLEPALKELGEVDLKIRGKIKKPNNKLQIINSQSTTNKRSQITDYKLGDMIATREAYGDALVKLGQTDSKILILDAEVSNSTYADKFKKEFPGRFFEMFLGEQNMISVGLGLSKLGFTVYTSTFAGFLSRAFDQIRIAQYSQPNLRIVQSHTGISIGADGPSQMGLEDIAMMRSILNCLVLYPSDGVSAKKLTELLRNYKGMSYLRLTREKTPLIYNKKEKFKIGGSKVHYINSEKSKIKTLIIAAGITLHEALKAQKELVKNHLETVVLDCYSVKPIDQLTIQRLTVDCPNVIVVEDHYPAGGLGETVADLIENCKLKIKNYLHLCVRKIPMSGTPSELLRYEEIDAEAIIKAAKNL